MTKIYTSYIYIYNILVLNPVTQNQLLHHTPWATMNDTNVSDVDEFTLKMNEDLQDYSSCQQEISITSH